MLSNEMTYTRRMKISRLQ